MKKSMTEIAPIPRKSGELVIREKLRDLNEYFKTADLTIVYESMGLPVPKKPDERSNN